MSRPSRISTSPPVRRITRQRRTPGAAAIASSAVRFSGTRPPRRQASSWVTSTSQPMSFIRSERESAEKPPKTTVCGAPSRVQASITAGSSGDHPEVDGDRRALADTPSSFSAFAKRTTSRCRSGVGDHAPVVLGLALPVVGDPVAEAGLDVPVDAVVGDVQPPADGTTSRTAAPTRARARTASPT